MAKRETVIAWEESTEGLEVLPQMAGIDFLKKMAAGELAGAPIAAHINMDLVEVDRGTVTFSAQPDASHYNPIGAVHGGFVCTLLDSALGCATHTTLPAGMGYTSIEIKVSYLRPVAADSGPLTCVGRVRGRQGHRPGRQDGGHRQRDSPDLPDRLTDGTGGQVLTGAALHSCLARTCRRLALGGQNMRAVAMAAAAPMSVVRNPNCVIAAPPTLGPTRVPIVRAVLTAASPADG
jgi:uncharacterized protein (TIGR00369 family)